MTLIYHKTRDLSTWLRARASSLSFSLSPSCFDAGDFWAREAGDFGFVPPPSADDLASDDLAD